MHREASRIISAIETKIDQKMRSGARIELTYGQVYEVHGAECSVYLVGSRELAESDGGVAEPSTGFRVPTHLTARTNDYVRVSMDERGDRWVEEVFADQPSMNRWRYVPMTEYTHFNGTASGGSETIELTGVPEYAALAVGGVMGIRRNDTADSSFKLTSLDDKGMAEVTTSGVANRGGFSNFGPVPVGGTRLRQLKYQSTTATTDLLWLKITGYWTNIEEAVIPPVTVINSFIAEAVLSGTAIPIKTFTADAVLAAEPTWGAWSETWAGNVGINIITADAVLKKTLSSTFVADAVLRKSFTATFTGDAVLATGGSAAVYVEDSFDRTLANQWGTASPTGGVWTITEAGASDFDVASGFGTIVTGANLAGRQISQDSISVDNIDETAIVKVDKVPTGTGAFAQVYVQGRRIDNNNRYSGRLRFNADGTLSVSIDRAVGGVFTTIAGPTTISGTVVANDLWRVRVQMDGASPTTIRIRAWKDGTAEPGTWQSTITDSSAALQVAGKVAIGFISSAMTNLPILLSVDKFTVTNISSGVITYAYDDFFRTLSDSWGTAVTGGTYTVKEGSATDFDVTGGVSTIIVGAAWQGKQIALDSVSARDVEYSIMAKANKQATGTGAYTGFWAQCRRIDTNNMYTFRLEHMADGTVRVSINRLVGGVSTVVAGPTTISGSSTADTWWVIKAQAVGASPTTVRMKAWVFGQTEPSSWQLETTDSGAGLQTAGAVGVQAFNSQTLTNFPVLYTFDELLVKATS
jgi:hypothetical protein